MSVNLSPDAFLTVDEFAARLRVSDSVKTANADGLARSLNGALAELERRTTRRLRARNYRTPVAVTGTVATSSGAYTLASPATLYVGDDVFGAGLAYGSRVTAVTDSTHGTITPAPSGTVTAAALTFCSGPLIVDGDGGSIVRIPESPLVTLYGLNVRNADRTLTAIDTTYARYDYDNARIVLVGVTLPRGDSNIEVECRCGYEARSATAAGSGSDYDAVATLLEDVGRIYWQRYQGQQGAASGTSAASFSESFDVGSDLPANLVQRILDFSRLG